MDAKPIVAGPGITVTCPDDRNYLITNSGDRNASDDVLRTSTFGGDVSGSFNSGLTVTGLNDIPLSGTPSEGDVLTFSRGRWRPEEPTSGGGGGSEPKVVAAASFDTDGSAFGAIGEGLRATYDDNGIAVVTFTDGTPMSASTHFVQITLGPNFFPGLSYGYEFRAGGVAVIIVDNAEFVIQENAFTITITSL